MTIPMSGMSTKDIQKEKEDEVKAFKEAFDYFDWNRSGTIPTTVSSLLLKVLTSYMRGEDDFYF